MAKISVFRIWFRFCVKARNSMKEKKTIHLVGYLWAWYIHYDKVSDKSTISILFSWQLSYSWFVWKFSEYFSHWPITITRRNLTHKHWYNIHFFHRILSSPDSFFTTLSKLRKQKISSRLRLLCSRKRIGENGKGMILVNTGLTEKETISPNLGALGDFQLFVNEFISFGNRFFFSSCCCLATAMPSTTVKVFVVFFSRWFLYTVE